MKDRVVKEIMKAVRKEVKVIIYRIKEMDRRDIKG